VKNLLEALNPRSPLVRRSIKLALLSVVVLFTLYPNPLFLVRHVQRSLSPSALIEPGNPRLDELDRELTRRVGPSGAAEFEDVLDQTQRLVYERVPYSYDWHNWGCANYFPTVNEVFERGRSDCKGMAVLAASLLARRGVQATLVSDLSHVWVWTPEGETMSPVRTASGRKVLSADQHGSRVDVLAVVGPTGLLADMPLRIGFAVAVFPLVRVAIIALALWVVMLRRVPDWRRALLGAWSIAGAIACFDIACENIHRAGLIGAWSGIFLAVLGLWMARGWSARASPDRSPG
jgi:hypothetical protein